MPRRKPISSISLPWENQGSRLGRLLAGARQRAVVTSLLVGLLAYGWLDAIHERRAERETRLAVAATTDAVRRFRSENGRCPRSLEELRNPPVPGTHYLTETPRDGWGHPLLVRCPSLFDPGEADILPAGPDGSYYDYDRPF